MPAIPGARVREGASPLKESVLVIFTAAGAPVDAIDGEDRSSLRSARSASGASGEVGSQAVPLHRPEA